MIQITHPGVTMKCVVLVYAEAVFHIINIELSFREKEMCFCFLLFVSLLCQGLTSPTEEVEVIEAIPGSEEMKENNNSRNEPSLGHLSLESLMDLGKPLKKHIYNTGLSKMSNLPPRMNGDHYSHKLFGVQKNNKRFDNKNAYNGPPPPPPLNQAQDKYDISKGDIWPAPVPDTPKIISLDVKCEKNLMKVYIGFDKPFHGIVFSKGHYSNVHCVHLPVGLGRTSAHFEIGIHACGTSGNTENGLYGYGSESGSGTYFENIIVIQYDPQVQEVWDQARKLRCTWHDQYEKSVTFRPFPVDMLDVVRTDFAGDNVGCWMQIQVGKGPWASEVSGLVKIGQTMTMVLAIKDDDSKFDMLVRNCMAHDGKRAPIQLVDQQGCLTRPKLMSRFTKIKNFGASASVLSYAHFQAFKFPDSMEVHFQCTIQICRYQCPDQCSDSSEHITNNGFIELSHGPKEYNYGIPPPSPHHISIQSYIHPNRPRDDRRSKRASQSDPEKEVGVNKVIRVVSTGDLTFSLDENTVTPPTIVFPARAEANNNGSVCMTNSGFAATLVVLLVILISSCLMSAFLCTKLRPLTENKVENVIETNSKKGKSFSSKSCFYS